MHLDGTKTLAVVLRSLTVRDGEPPSLTHAEITPDHGLSWHLVHNLNPDSDDERFEFECNANGAEFWWHYEGEKPAQGFDLVGYLEFLGTYLVGKIAAATAA
jgi:hypothetical protein